MRDTRVTKYKGFQNLGSLILLLLIFHGLAISSHNDIHYNYSRDFIQKNEGISSYFTYLIDIAVPDDQKVVPDKDQGLNE
jgi:hypothetical protein